MQSHRSLSTGKGGVGKGKVVGVCGEGCWGGKVLGLGS